MRILKSFKLLIAGCLVAIGIAPNAQALERHCDAVYTWETTGGSAKGTFGNFNGQGECGNVTVANRCRIRARSAIETCVATHWAKRGDAEVPESCIENSSDRTVIGYDMSLRCTWKVGDPPSACWVVRTLQPNVAYKNRLIASKGDIKAKLEGEVCCAYQNGNHTFSNNSSVLVRLSYRTSGDNNCSGGGTLSDSYKINCTAVRQNFCRH
jgi:hypothetical protein